MTGSHLCLKPGAPSGWTGCEQQPPRQLRKQSRWHFWVKGLPKIRTRGVSAQSCHRLQEALRDGTDYQPEVDTSTNRTCTEGMISPATRNMTEVGRVGPPEGRVSFTKPSKDSRATGSRISPGAHATWEKAFLQVPGLRLEPAPLPPGCHPRVNTHPYPHPRGCLEGLAARPGHRRGAAGVTMSGAGTNPGCSSLTLATPPVPSEDGVDTES